MIKFFRKIRYNLMGTGKKGKYFKYAIGEILLVVIGILIALGINNWNENRKDRILEQNYINELRTDLQKDSIAIKNLVDESNKQVTSKYLLSKYLEDHTNLKFYSSTEIYPEFVKTENYNKDSLFVYYRKVWQTTYNFTPITTTIDEMKSTGRIGIITDKKLRRTIIETYNNYELFLSRYEVRYDEIQQEGLKMIIDDIPELYLLDNSNLIKLLHNPRVLNRFQGNFVVTFNKGLLELQNVNQKLLNALNE